MRTFTATEKGITDLLARASLAPDAIAHETLDDGRWRVDADEMVRLGVALPAVTRKERREPPPDVIVEPVPETPAKPAPWPLAAKLIALMRAPEDKGLGDTIARNIDRLRIGSEGASEFFKRMYSKITGQQCRCEDRQAKLNNLYGY